MFILKQLFFIVNLLMKKAEDYSEIAAMNLHIEEFNPVTDTSNWDISKAINTLGVENKLELWKELPSVRMSNIECEMAYLIIDDHRGQRCPTYTIVYWVKNERFFHIEFDRQMLNNNSYASEIYGYWYEFLIGKDKFNRCEPIEFDFEEREMEKRMQKNVVDPDTECCEICGRELGYTTLRNGYKNCGRCA